MNGTVEELVARLGAAQKKLAALEAKERPLVLRGWRDDFLGDSLAGEYETQIQGAGSVVATLQDAAHGGVVRMTAGPGVARYSRLWLGSAAGNHDTLDADYGWIQLGRARIQATTNINARILAAQDAAANNVIFAASQTGSNANWNIITRTGGGAFNIVDSGFALDTDWHVHRLEVGSTPTGRRVDHLLDGQLINSTTVSVPTAVITPIIFSAAVAAVSRWVDWDYWDVIPQNLV